MRSPYKINLALSVLFLICLAIVFLTGTNKPLFIIINSATSRMYPSIWANITFLGDSLPACLIMLLFIRKKPELVWSGIVASLIATLIVNLLKYYIVSPRPPSVIEAYMINIIGPALYSHSFPSGHTVTIFTLAGLLVFYFRTFLERLAIITIGLLIGISRIAVGVHWPADVLGGAALGILSAMAGYWIISKLKWGWNKPAQFIVGFILILCGFYLLLIYDSKYKQASYLQIIFSLTVLVAGIREYYYLILESRGKRIST
jgi:membrane-associated phospholipid phosphatase